MKIKQRTLQVALSVVILLAFGTAGAVFQQITKLSRNSAFLTDTVVIGLTAIR